MARQSAAARPAKKTARPSKRAAAQAAAKKPRVKAAPPTAALSRKSSRKPVSRKPVSRATEAQKPKPRKPQTLGRPKVTGEELLYLLFKEDYHARQVFEFLRVKTVKELEQYSAAEIIRRLSQPVRNTVERIRQSLAACNRCLADDLEYALEQKAQHEK